jgi:co-chaperonin GroES (HSP10)
MTKAAYSPHQIPRDNLKALHNHIIVNNMDFDQRLSNGGIILLNDNGKGTGIRPRWGQVYAVGSEQKDVAIGQWILVAHGRWTRGLDIEDEQGKQTIRRVDPKDILLISNTEPKDETFSDAVHIEKKPDDVCHN